jgi:hypothetical protein
MRSAYLDDSLTANHVGSRTNSHRPTLRILNRLTSTDQLPQIIKFTRAIGVRKHHILAPNVAHSVRDGASFTSILGQGHDSNAARRDMNSLAGPR